MRDVLRLTFLQALRLSPRLVAGFTGTTGGLGSTGRLLSGVEICCTCVKVLEGHFLVGVKTFAPTHSPFAGPLGQRWCAFDPFGREPSCQLTCLHIPSIHRAYEHLIAESCLAVRFSSKQHQIVCTYGHCRIEVAQFSV